MHANEPRELDALFEDAYAARDAEALSALFTEDAVVIAPGGEELRGRRSVAALAGGFWADELAYVSEPLRVVSAGDVALLMSRWTMSDRDGTVVERGVSIDVARRDRDGAWRYVIGMPEGAA